MLTIVKKEHKKENVYLKFCFAKFAGFLHFSWDCVWLMYVREIELLRSHSDFQDEANQSNRSIVFVILLLFVISLTFTPKPFKPLLLTMHLYKTKRNLCLFTASTC